MPTDWAPSAHERPAEHFPPGRQPPQLLVFLHVALKQRAFQTELQAALGDVDVTAVGRTADFDRGLAEAPDAVLDAPRGAGGARPAWPPRRGAQGLGRRSSVRAGGRRLPARSGDGSASVGVLDLLGRDGHGTTRARPAGAAAEGRSG